MARAVCKIQATSTSFRSRLAARKSHLRLPKTPYPAHCITCDAALDRTLRLSCCRSCGFLVGYLQKVRWISRWLLSHVIPCFTSSFVSLVLSISVSVDLTLALIAHRQVLLLLNSIYYNVRQQLVGSPQLPLDSPRS